MIGVKMSALEQPRPAHKSMIGFFGCRVENVSSVAVVRTSSSKPSRATTVISRNESLPLPGNRGESLESCRARARDVRHCLLSTSERVKPDTSQHTRGHGRPCITIPRRVEQVLRDRPRLRRPGSRDDEPEYEQGGGELVEAVVVQPAL